MTSRQYVDLLWCQAARTDSRIEPIACGERQWEEDDSSPHFSPPRGVAAADDGTGDGTGVAGLIGGKSAASGRLR
jgi:hypothetical protein